MDKLLSGVQTLFSNIAGHLGSISLPDIGDVAQMFFWLGGTVLHIAAAALVVAVLWRCARSLLGGKAEEEDWGFFALPNGVKLQLTHWENILGRAGSCDIVLAFATISRQHAAVQRTEDGEWTIYPLSEKNGVAVNGARVKTEKRITLGDKVTLGGLDLIFYPSAGDDLRRQAKARTKPGRRVSPTMTLALLSAFQGLMLVELVYSKGVENMMALFSSFGILCAAMWAMYLVYRSLRRTGFELESLAFLLTTLCLTVTASSSMSTLPKQTLSVLIGLILFMVLSICLRDLDRAKSLRWPAAILAAGLLAFNVLFGQTLFGAKNWVSFGPISFQPSEFVKIAFVLAGAETMDRLFSRRNLIFTILFSAFCVGCLAVMSDFGTALIFFVAFLTIAFLRSGDLPSIAMITAAAAVGAGVVLKFKPYIANRFAVWRHVWEFSDTTGYQQTRAMSATASGGLFGVGANGGWLKAVGAANTDLVFGMVAEELGLIVAVSAVITIIVFALFTIKYAGTARSAFYAIAACAAATMFVFQTILNVCGSMDILPLTGVTFPFVSCGGSSMMSCWALFAFLKACDLRQNAAIAVKLPKKHDAPVEINDDGFEIDASVFDDDAPYDSRGKERADIDIPLDDDPPQSRKHHDIDISLDDDFPQSRKRPDIDIPLDDDWGDDR
ncbi:MAG: FtsW/RodA/SpoVE family cell cycle protein [Oscillospiraceae bacterium]|nr:FtsW/RodA/SpoVE family cell cycle protein [Oscillospiraceae bacterium]